MRALFIRLPFSASMVNRTWNLRPDSASGRLSERMTCESTNHEIRFGVTSTAKVCHWSWPKPRFIDAW